MSPRLSRAASHVQIQAAVLALRRGDHEPSARLAYSALALAKALDCPVLLAHAHLAVARASLAVGDNDHTLAMLEASWPLVRDGDDLTLRFWYQTNFAIALSDLDQSADAKAWYLQSAETARQLGTPRLIALAAAHVTSAWLNLADSAHDRGDAEAASQAWHQALQTADESLPLIRQTRVERWIAMALLNRCVALACLERDEQALAGIAQVAHLPALADWPELKARMHFTLAKIWHRQGDLLATMAALKEAEAVGMAGRARSVMLLILDLASRVAEQSGDLVQALSSTRQLHALYVEMAADRATMRSRLLAVRLATERAQAEAEAERQQRMALSERHLALKRQAASLRHEANHDPLTGLSNRRRFDLALGTAHAEAVSQGRCLCLVMLDIDHFKSINDRHSHLVGDQVLREIGSLLAAACRQGDLAARYGGEEFAVLMSHGTIPQATAMAERLRRSIQEFAWSGVAPGMQVTASFGVSDIARSPHPQDGLLLTDQRLYAAKQQGRNRVVSDPTD